MKCSEAKELFLIYISEEMEGNLKREFEEHLKECASCKKELELLSSFVNNIEEKEVKVPPELDFKTMEIIEKQERDSLFHQITKLLYPVVFALGLIIGVLLGMGLNKKQEDKILSLIKENTFYIEPYIQNISPEEVLNERTK